MLQWKSTIRWFKAIATVSSMIKTHDSNGLPRRCKRKPSKTRILRLSLPVLHQKCVVSFCTPCCARKLQAEINSSFLIQSRDKDKENVRRKNSKPRARGSLARDKFRRECETRNSCLHLCECARERSREMKRTWPSVDQRDILSWRGDCFYDIVPPPYLRIARRSNERIFRRYFVERCKENPAC